MDKSQKKLLDFLNKVKKVFSKDFMIYHNYYIIPGIESSEKLDGLVLLIVNDKYREELSLIFNEKKSYNIESIDLLKNNIENENVSDYYNEISDSEFKLPYSYDDDALIKTVLDDVSKPDIVWNKLSDNKDIIKIFFSDKASYELPIYDYERKKKDTITIGKELFPHISEKNIDLLFFTSKYIEDIDLYMTYFDFRWDYFQMICRYYSIPLNE